MERPKWLRFIVVSGIILTIAGAILLVLEPYFQKQVALESFVFNAIVTIFMTFAFLRLYQLKNWAREVVILYSAVSAVPVFVFVPQMPFLFLALSAIQCPLSVFYVVYLMKGSTRACFTASKRSALKIAGGIFLVIFTVAFLGTVSLLNTLIDFDSGKLTAKGSRFISKMRKYDEKRWHAQNVMGIIIPDKFTVTNAQESPGLSMVEFVVGGTVLDGQYVGVFSFEDIRDLSLDAAVSIVYSGEYKRLRKNIVFGEKRSLRFGARSIQARDIRYKGSDGVVGVYRSPRFTVFFISYVLGKDKTRVLNEELLRETLQLFR